MSIASVNVQVSSAVQQVPCIENLLGRARVTSKWGTYSEQIKNRVRKSRQFFHEKETEYFITYNPGGEPASSGCRQISTDWTLAIAWLFILAPDCGGECSRTGKHIRPFTLLSLSSRTVRVQVQTRPRCNFLRNQLSLGPFLLFVALLRPVRVNTADQWAVFFSRKDNTFREYLTPPPVFLLFFLCC